MTEVKSLPKSLVGIVEAMEFEQPHTVSLPMLTQIAINSGATSDETGTAKLAYRLQELGWLGSLRTKNAWEFIPGSRAGAYSSGDRFIEFRAYLLVHPEWPGALAMESAASMLGLAQHIPDREVVSLPSGMALPKAMYDWRRVTTPIWTQGHEMRDGMPCWNLEGLLVGIAMRPSGYHDLAGLAQWLPDGGAQLDKAKLRACLSSEKESVWQRAAYLIGVAGASDIAAELMAERPPHHMIWFSATRTNGVYDPISKVSDADLAPYLEGGTGA